MTDIETLKEILNLSKESSERDTRIEAQLCYMEKRMSSMEELTAKMSETLNETKHMQTTIDSLSATVIDNTKRIQTLEEKAGKLALKAWQKIAGVFIGVGLTALAAYVINLLKTIINLAASK